MAFLVPCLAGNRLFVDHGNAEFIFDGSGRQLNVTLDVMMRWFWRVRQWRLTGSIFHHVPTGTRTDTLDFILKRMRPAWTGGPPDVEVEHEFDIAAYSGLFIGAGLTSAGLSASCTIPLHSSGVSYRASDHTFGFGTPSAAFSFQSVSGGISTVTFSSAGGAFLIGACTVDGISLPLYTLSGGDAAAGMLATLVLDPSRFYAYSTSLGQPVYDEDTGAQINDPFA